MELGDIVKFKKTVTQEEVEALGVDVKRLNPTMEVTKLEFLYVQVDNLFSLRTCWLEKVHKEQN